MAANGGQPPPEHHACKCLNIRIRPQPNKDTPPPAEAGFKSIYVGEEGIRVAHPEVTLRSRSRAVPLSGSPTAELTRFITVTCLVCGLLTYRVSQRVTPDLSTDEGPVLPTDDWVEKELCKSSNGWIEVYQESLIGNEVTQAESSPMYSKLFRLILPGGTPPSAASATSEGEAPKVENARGPSEQGKKHLPELPALFLPPPFTPSNVVFSHLSALASEQSQKLRDEAEEYIAQVTERKVAEVLRAEAALKREVDLIWGRFRENLVLQQQAGSAVSPIRRRSSVSGHVRAASNPAPETSASVRISSFVPTPTQSNRSSPTHRQAVSSALSASLKTSGMQYPGAQREVNGNGNGIASPVRRAGRSPPSPARSSTTRVHSTSTASSRTAALSIDAETSIREAYRREMDESKDMATSYRYTMNIEAQMEQQRLQTLAEAEAVPPPAASPPTPSTSSHVPPDGAATTTAAGRSTRVHKSAIKNPAPPANRSASPKDKAKAGAIPEDNKDSKGKRKVTFDVQPEVAIISKEEGEIASEQPTPSETVEDPIFDMDNESEQSAGSRDSVPVEQAKNPPPSPASTQRVRTPPRPSHSRSSSNSGLPPQLQSLRPASLPHPSAMRPPPVRHTTPPSAESAERSRALRESLVGEKPRSEVVESPINVAPGRVIPDEPHDPREEEILKLVAASTPSHRSAWKKNSKAWQVFFSRRELKAGEAAPEAIEEEGSYVLDDFDPALGRRFNGIADSDVTDEDEGDDNKWPDRNDDHPIAQSLPIPIGLNHHRQIFGIPAYEPKTSLSDRPGLLVPALRNSSTSSSLRRASYAERDRVRPVDPGALDFAGDDDDEYDDDVDSDPETGGKARQRALKILKARNELPAAGELIPFLRAV
ncbi:hypothetical protein BD309DRAFT_852542 [Dichomitus squalens]|uniref:Uncharacterized protein n=1 Tax=Dichomitus squalens TaxID=114155 RepID=A0A4V6MWY6_9APHY|nr:hypothetical protein BD309DRAFT_852542 [Dichomitus squalens]TBU64098.1 hypothetical protein BD310DRAFT_806961 [Dichomitus squalens]